MTEKEAWLYLGDLYARGRLVPFCLHEGIWIVLSESAVARNFVEVGLQSLMLDRLELIFSIDPYNISDCLYLTNEHNTIICCLLAAMCDEA